MLRRLHLRPRFAFGHAAGLLFFRDAAFVFLRVGVVATFESVLATSGTFVEIAHHTAHCFVSSALDGFGFFRVDEFGHATFDCFLQKSGCYISDTPFSILCFLPSSPVSLYLPTSFARIRHTTVPKQEAPAYTRFEIRRPRANNSSNSVYQPIALLGMRF